jgi:hydrogenase maturation factor HypF (carbamoyltransferase family)
MQADRYNTNQSVHSCAWCNSEYAEAYSRAREIGVFCCKKCEIEARYWLRESLSQVTR